MMHPNPDQIAYMQAHVNDDRRPWLIGINIACMVLAYVSVGLRFASRFKIGTHIGLDDWLICGAVACITGHVSCLLATIELGMGRHIILLTDPKRFVITILTAQTFYNLSIPFIKLSILCLYARIFRRTNGWFMPILWLTALFVFLFAIPQCFVYIFQCVPIESLWTDFGPGYRVVCIDFKTAIVVFGAIHIFTDWFILALPIPVVLSLQLEKRTKYSICSLFLIGGFVCVISIVRLIYAKNVETVDPTWDYSPIATLSTLECCSGILAACMPTWRPLFRFLGRGITSYFSGSKSGGEDPALKYGNNVEISHRRWRRSQSRSRSRRRTIADKPVTVNGVRGSRISFKPGNKRSDTGMSGESFEKILKGRITPNEIELSPSLSKDMPGETSHSGTSSASPYSTSNLDLNPPTSGNDRGLGLEGITVTKSVTSIGGMEPARGRSAGG